VDANDADVIGDEPIWFNSDPDKNAPDEVKGWVTSGGYAHNSGVSVAMGYVPQEIADEKHGWSIEILGQRYSATLQEEALFDPKGRIMRA
jgi:dimethylglycine dehydrogenase